MSQAKTGILIIVVGLIMLGHQLHLGFNFGRYWPVILIVIGFSRFLTIDDDGHRQNGGWLLLVGGLLLLNNLRILGLGDSWPLFIVGAGIGMMFGRDRRARNQSTPGAGGGSVPPNHIGSGSVQS
jgi:hypothetical protein